MINKNKLKYSMSTRLWCITVFIIIRCFHWKSFSRKKNEHLSYDLSYYKCREQCVKYYARVDSDDVSLIDHLWNVLFYILDGAKEYAICTINNMFSWWSKKKRFKSFLQHYSTVWKFNTNCNLVLNLPLYSF